jgi:heavy metal sensor kinase
MIRIRPRHVRTRLTLWYVGVLAGVLMLYAAGTSTFLFFNLRQDLDRNTIQDLETIEGLLNFGPDGTLRLGTDYKDMDEHEAEQERFMEVRDLNGALLYRNKRLRGWILGGSPAPGEGKAGYSERSARLPDGTRIRLVSRLHTVAARPTLIRLAHSEEPLWREFREMASVLLLGLPIALAVAGFVGYGLARRALAPLDSMACRAEQITAERLSERLPVENPQDELGHLARVFNDTLARLERSFEQLRRFTADASHELRTPLTAIRTVGEVGLQKDGDAAHYRDTIGSMLEEVNALTRLVDDLLTISRADAGHIQLRPTNISILDLARESAALLEVLAEEKGQHLSVEGDRGSVAYGDRLILRQALVNLIDNAVKHSPVGGRISIRVEPNGGNEAVLEVEDSGPGIEPAHQSKVFDRFYRIDKARSRDAGGAGLGLSIAKWAVEANGGRIELESEQDRGCTFRIRLPLARQQELSPVGT